MTKPLKLLFLAPVFTNLAALTSVCAADKALLDFAGQMDLTGVVTTDAKVSVVKSGNSSALRISAGHQQSWPGVTLPPPGETGPLQSGRPQPKTA